MAIQQLQRKEIYGIEDVLKLVSTGMKSAHYHDDQMDLTSQRYETFLHKGTTCCLCGIEGRYFAKERHWAKKREGKVIVHVPKIGTPWHFNLYAVDENGEEVLMTKDHILAKVEGGKDVLSNYRTMCSPCNSKLGIELRKRLDAERKEKNG